MISRNIVALMLVAVAVAIAFAANERKVADQGGNEGPEGQALLAEFKAADGAKKIELDNSDPNMPKKFINGFPLCYWKGQAPLCRGWCGFGEIYQGAASYYVPGLPYPEYFGESCVAGAKFLCCRY